MESNLKTFMSLTEPDLVAEISEILGKENIAHKVHDNRADFNPAFSNNNSGKSIDILLLPKDFKTAQVAIDEKLELKADSMDTDHFLFDFSENELRDVIKNADEWHPLDVKLARHILGTKGISLTQSEISAMEKQRIAEQSRPENSFTTGIVLGYISAIAGGLLGLFIGMHLINYKKTLPDGSQVHNYGDSDRKHGRIMTVISIISIAGWTLLWVYKHN